MAAVGAAAVIVLVIGLVTVGALNNPADQAAAVDQTTSAARPPTQTETAGPHRPTAESPTVYTPTERATTGTTVGRAREWVRTLEALDAQRAQAFWTLDVGVLDKIYVPGSAPWSADRELVASYRRQQVRVHGLRIRIETTTIERRTSNTITLRTVDHLVAGEVVDRNGTRTPLPPATATTRLITLTTTRSTPTWRITTITSA